MGILALRADERVEAVNFTQDSLVVSLKDGRVISVPLTWYPRLLEATPAARQNWQLAGAGYGIHWPELDEDLSTEGLLRGAPAPDRKSTRLNSSHLVISYAVFCLKKKIYTYRDRQKALRPSISLRDRAC